MFRKSVASVCVLLFVLSAAPVFAADASREPASLTDWSGSVVGRLVTKFVRMINKGPGKVSSNSDMLTVPKP